MANQTAIEWCDLSWNPVHGCSKVSPGCAHCYAETLSRRYHQTPKPWTPANVDENVILKPHKLREPLSNAKPWRGLGAAAEAAGKTEGQLVFVNSTSDLFHEQVPDSFIAQVFEIMAWADNHTFQVLTKRPERMRDLLDSADWRRSTGVSVWPLPNVWLGTSIENRRFVHRANALRNTWAAVRFISAEPLLGPLIPTQDLTIPVDYGTGIEYDWAWEDGASVTDDLPGLSLLDIDWLIVGGESGPHHRPIEADWVRALRDIALGCDTAFFFKQWGGRTPKAGGRELDGRTWNEFPAQAEVTA